MLRRLSVRIALLIMILGPTLLAAAVIITTFYIRTGRISRFPLALLELPLIALLIPLILGILAARFVSEPLRDLADAIASLRRNNYRIQLPPSDVAEFDPLIAEVNQLSARLEQEESLRRNLISDTAHELGTPISALYAQLKGVKDGVLQLDPERIQTLYEQTERLTDLVNRLGEYSSIRAATIRPQLVAVDVAKLARKLQRHFAPDLRAAGLALALDVTAEPLTADPKLLERLLANLIANAIRYSHGTTVTLHYDGRRLAVADDGRGIPAVALPFIFERFYRVDQSRSRATGGLGLGLAIAQEIAQAHGWALTAANTHPGARFTVAL